MRWWGLAVWVALGCGSSSSTSGGALDGGAEGGADGSVTVIDGGADAGGGTCLPTPTSFELTVGGRYCNNGPSCEGGSLLTVIAADGRALARGNPCATTGNCPQPQLITGPATTSWDGSFVTSCQPTLVHDCAAAGHYIARMCAYPDTATSGSACTPPASGPPKCVDVPFDWPTTTTVRGSLP
jgi:hypothetical protein